VKIRLSLTLSIDRGRPGDEPEPPVIMSGPDALAEKADDTLEERPRFGVGFALPDPAN
jgi:hypothetical protein